jgi:hypothetical protein
MAKMTPSLSQKNHKEEKGGTNFAASLFQSLIEKLMKLGHSGFNVYCGQAI